MEIQGDSVADLEIVSQSIKKRRTRTDMANHKVVLEDLWHAGMQNISTPNAKEKMAEAVIKTGLTAKQIKDWVTNKKMTLRRQNGEAPPPKPKVKIREQKPTGYSIYLKQAMTHRSGRTQAEINNEWANIKETEAVRGFFEEANAFIPSKPTPEEKAKMVEAKICAFQRSIADLEKLDVEIGAYVVDKTSGKYKIVGSDLGVEAMMRQPESHWPIVTAILGTVTPMRMGKKNHNRREQVQELFNVKYAQLVGRPGARCPYQEISKGTLRAEGLPSGIQLKTPGSYGQPALAAILEAADFISLKFENCEQNTHRSNTAQLIGDQRSQVKKPTTGVRNIRPGVVRKRKGPQSKPDTVDDIIRSMGQPVSTDTGARSKPDTVDDIIKSRGQPASTDTGVQSKTDAVENLIRTVEQLVSSDNDEEYKVEKLLGKRTKKGELQYLVRWEGFDSTSDTWEPADYISDDLIQSYTENEQTA